MNNQKKTINIGVILFLLFTLVHCGDSGSTGSLNEQGAKENITEEGGAPPTSNPVEAGRPRPTNNERRSTVPGYVCNHEGICIPESRASKRKDTDAFGNRKGVYGVPYKE